MTIISSINKGKGYERKIAGILQRRFGVEFHRVPMSGGFATTTGVQATEFVGDLFTDDKAWNEKHNVVIECKKIGVPITLLHYAKYLVGKDVLMARWVKQCMANATHRGQRKDFWLVFAWNYGQDLVMKGTFVDGDWQISEPLELYVFLNHVIEDDESYDDKTGAV